MRKIDFLAGILICGAIAAGHAGSAQTADQAWLRADQQRYFTPLKVLALGNGGRGVEALHG